MVVLHQESAMLLVHEAMRRGQVVLSRDQRFDGMKVFCAETDATAWIDAHREHELVDITVVQNGGWISIVIAFRDSARSRR
jgi:hypothetical protein